MCKNKQSYGTKEVNFQDIELVDPDKISSCKIICCGIEGKRAYAMTEPRNEKIELDLIKKIEVGPDNLLDLLLKLGV